MQTERPYFRPDLKSQLLLRGGKRFVEVSCPQTGTSFEFFETEYAVACGMDGYRDLDGLLSWSKEELGFQPSAGDMKAVVDKLSSLGYLVGQTPPAVASTPVAENYDLGNAGPSAAQQSSQVPVEEVALGSAGSTADVSASPVQPAADIGLGVSGGGSGFTVPSTPTAPVSDVALGAPGNGNELGHEAIAAPVAAALPEPEPQVSALVAEPGSVPSVNLEGHLDFDAGPSATPPQPASKEVPADIDTVTERMDTDARALAQPLGSLEPAPEPTPVPASNPNNGAVPVVLQAQPARTTGSLEVPAVLGGTAIKEKPVKRPLIAVGVIVLLAIAGAAYYWFFHHLPGLADASHLNPSAERAAKIKKNAQLLIQPVATVEFPAAPPSVTVESSRSGKIEWMVARDTVVSVEDAVARYAGFEDARKRQLDRKALVDSLGDKLENGVKRKSLARVKGAFEKAQSELAAATETLELLTLKSSQAGRVEPLVDLTGGPAEVEEGQDIMRLTNPDGLVLSFDLGNQPEGYSAGTVAEIAPESDPEMRVACKYIGAEGNVVRLSCPLDSGLTAGAKVGLYRNAATK